MQRSNVPMVTITVPLSQVGFYSSSRPHHHSGEYEARRYLESKALSLSRFELSEMQQKLKDYSDVFCYLGAEGFKKSRWDLREMQGKLKDYPDVFRYLGVEGFKKTRWDLREMDGKIKSHPELFQSSCVHHDSLPEFKLSR